MTCCSELDTAELCYYPIPSVSLQPFRILLYYSFVDSDVMRHLVWLHILQAKIILGQGSVVIAVMWTLFAVVLSSFLFKYTTPCHWSKALGKGHDAYVL